LINVSSLYFRYDNHRRIIIKIQFFPSIIFLRFISKRCKVKYQISIARRRERLPLAYVRNRRDSLVARVACSGWAEWNGCPATAPCPGQWIHPGLYFITCSLMMKVLSPFCKTLID